MSSTARKWQISHFCILLGLYFWVACSRLRWNLIGPKFCSIFKNKELTKICYNYLLKINNGKQDDSCSYVDLDSGQVRFHCGWGYQWGHIFTQKKPLCLITLSRSDWSGLGVKSIEIELKNDIKLWIKKMTTTTIIWTNEISLWEQKSMSRNININMLRAGFEAVWPAAQCVREMQFLRQSRCVPVSHETGLRLPGNI